MLFIKIPIPFPHHNVISSIQILHCFSSSLTESQNSDSIFSLIKADYDDESLESQEIQQEVRNEESVAKKSNSNAAEDVGGR